MANDNSMTIREYEDAYKGITKAARLVGNAGRSVQDFDEKLRFERVRAELHKAIAILRLQHFEIEDALAINDRHRQTQLDLSQWPMR